MAMPPQARGATEPYRTARRSRRGLFLTCGTLTVLLLAAAATVGGLIVKPLLDKAAALDGAARTATAFCTDLKAQDYASAYGELSSGYQASLAQTQFTQAAKLHDQIDGPVTACGVPRQADAHGVSVTDRAVTLPATIARKKTASGAITLVKQGSAWRLDKVDAALQGTDLGPLQVADTYCQALVRQDYPTAYSTFSSAYQSARGSEADFAARFQSLAQNGVKITACTPLLDTYTVAPDDESASLGANLTLSVNGAAVPGGIRSTLTFKKEQAVWKIDDVQTSAF
jgi:hypothetical protein